ncbi:MAG: hypothetical protein IKC27_00935 [Kiritimatiellae bacterium]|nr:hypothetical protein [Kiritimatiellia bacterium]
MKRLKNLLCGSAAKSVVAAISFVSYSSFAVIDDIVGLIPKPEVKFSGEFETTFLSGYLGSSGAIYDTRPNLSNCFSFRAEVDDAYFVDGYAWFISSLHNKQGDSHRMLFHEFEGAVRFGYDYKMSDDIMLETKAGLLWNPAIGYKDASLDGWGPYVAQYLKNKYLIPYWDGLWIVSPSRRARVRLGVRKPFKITGKLTISPFCETVWLDKRRFIARYDEEPEDDFVMGGAFGSITFGFSVKYEISPDFTVFGSFSQFDLINSQARDSVKKADEYYAKCDWPIIKIGFSYSF